jgi:hypothetical protein
MPVFGGLALRHGPTREVVDVLLDVTNAFRLDGSIPSPLRGFVERNPAYNTNATGSAGALVGQSMGQSAANGPPLGRCRASRRPRPRSRGTDAHSGQPHAMSRIRGSSCALGGDPGRGTRVGQWPAGGASARVPSVRPSVVGSFHRLGPVLSETLTFQSDLTPRDPRTPACLQCPARGRA